MWPSEWETAFSDTPLVVVFVRHGRTAWNRERRILGTTDIPLDDLGQAQARALGEWLPARLDVVYTSPLKRAYDTAMCLDSRPVVESAWTEMRQGDLEGLSKEEALARFPEFFGAWIENPAKVTLPGGESLRDCRDRVWEALEQVARRHERGVIGVVSHQMVISSLVCTASGEPLEEWRKHALPNAACTLLGWRERRWHVLLRAYRPATVQALEAISV